MQEKYVTPGVEIIFFTPNRAIAMDEPGWGWEEDVFSTTEAQNIDEDAERRDGNEG